MTFDFDTDVTLGDQDAMEQYCGAPLSELDLGSAKARIYLAYLALRVKDPGATLEDARALNIQAFNDLFTDTGGGDGDPPGGAAPAASGTPGSPASTESTRGTSGD